MGKGIRVTFTKLEFRQGDWTKAFEAKFEKVFREALFAFVEATQARVPVRTGMALGSLGLLASWAGYPLDRLRGAKPTLKRNAQAGEEQSSLDISRFAFPKYGFTFETHLFHYILHEHARLGKDGWESFAAGKLAFKAYLKEHLKQSIPKISDYLDRTEVIRGR